MRFNDKVHIWLTIYIEMYACKIFASLRFCHTFLCKKRKYKVYCRFYPLAIKNVSRIMFMPYAFYTMRNGIGK